MEWHNDRMQHERTSLSFLHQLEKPKNPCYWHLENPMNIIDMARWRSRVFFLTWKTLVWGWTSLGSKTHILTLWLIFKVFKLSCAFSILRGVYLSHMEGLGKCAPLIHQIMPEPSILPQETNMKWVHDKTSALFWVFGSCSTMHFHCSPHALAHLICDPSKYQWRFWKWNDFGVMDYSAHSKQAEHIGCYKCYCSSTL